MKEAQVKKLPSKVEGKLLYNCNTGRFYEPCSSEANLEGRHLEEIQDNRLIGEVETSAIHMECIDNYHNDWNHEEDAEREMHEINEKEGTRLAVACPSESIPIAVEVAHCIFDHILEELFHRRIAAQTLDEESDSKNLDTMEWCKENIEVPTDGVPCDKVMIREVDDEVESENEGTTNRSSTLHDSLGRVLLTDWWAEFLQNRSDSSDQLTFGFFFEMAFNFRSKVGDTEKEEEEEESLTNESQEEQEDSADYVPGAQCKSTETRFQEFQPLPCHFRWLPPGGSGRPLPRPVAHLIL